MKRYALALYPTPPETLFPIRTVAQLVRVSEDFVRRCLHAELVKARIMLHGRRGLGCYEVRRLKRVRHLHQDLGLNLEAIDLVLRYRKRLQTLQQRYDELERRLYRREAELQAQIDALRRRLPPDGTDQTGA